ncbi:MAG: hypothetical protein J7M14_01415, partial [Planctomycetes bacterium]|nr:hypothetical protein [Planctomycetota bacterium]
AYEAVPRGLPEYMQARQRALKSRSSMLAFSEEDRIAKGSEARKLVEKLLDYGRDVLAVISASTDKIEIADLRRWGSEAEFLAAKMLYEELDCQARALRILDALSERWPGTDVLIRGEDFRIRKLVEIGHTGKAVDALERFKAKHPAEAARLLPLLIEKVQAKIAALRGVDLVEDELKVSQQNYLKLVEELFRRRRDETLAERYRITQIYADALLENGRVDEALELLLQCKAHDDAARKIRHDAIDRQFKVKLDAVQSDKASERDLAAARNDFDAMLRHDGIDPESSGKYVQVGRGWEYYKRADPGIAGDKEKRFEELRVALVEGLTKLRETRKDRVPVEAWNLLGLAKAYKAMGERFSASPQGGRPAQQAQDAYRKALGYYKRLVTGVRGDGGEARMFWQANLGLCECILGGYSRDKRAMSSLLTRIRQLRNRSQAMGGLFARFNAIESKAKQLHGQ